MGRTNDTTRVAGRLLHLDGEIDFESILLPTLPGLVLTSTSPTTAEWLPTSGVGASQAEKNEDSQHASGAVGDFTLGVRNDLGIDLTDQDGDYSPFATDSAGRLGITTLGGDPIPVSFPSGGSPFDINIAKVGGNTVTTTVPVSGSVSITGTPTVTANQGGAWSIGRTWNLVFASDKVDVSGSTVTVSNPGTFPDPIGVKGVNGTSIATAINPFPTSVQGTVAATQSGSWTVGVSNSFLLETTFTSRINTLGQKTSALSTPVVLASDQSAIPATQSGSWAVSVSNFPATYSVTQGTSPWVVSGTVTSTPSGLQNVNVTQYGSQATSLGQKFSTSSQPVVLSTEQEAVLNNILDSAGAGQLVDTGNSAVITSTSHANGGHNPSTPFTGVNYATTANDVQECISILTAFDGSGNPIPDLGFTFTFRGNPEGIVRTVTIPAFTSTRLLHTTDWLSNQWTNYQVEMTPSRALVAGETIVIATRHSRQAGNKFLYPLDYSFLVAAQTTPVTQAFQKGVGYDGSLGLFALPQNTPDDANSLGITGHGANGAVTALDSVDFTTDTFTKTTHGLSNGDVVHLTTTGTLPAGLTDSTTNATTLVVSETPYWVRDVTANTFKLSASISGSTVGSAVNFTDNGTGTHSFQKRFQFVGSVKDIRQVGHLFTYILATSKPVVARLEWFQSSTAVTDSIVGTSAIPLQVFEDIIGPGIDLYVGVLPTNDFTDEYYRIRYVAGPASNLFFELRSQVGREGYHGTFSALNAALSNLSTALITRSVLAGTNPDLDFVNVAIPGRSTENSNDVPLAGDPGTSYLNAFQWTASTLEPHIFRGKWKLVQGNYVKVAIDYSSDVAGNVYIDISQLNDPTDDVDDDISESFLIEYDPVDDPVVNEHKVVRAKWVRSRVVNDIAAQAFTDLDVAFLTVDPGGDTRELHEGVKEDDMAEITQTVGSTLDEDSDEDAPLYTQDMNTLNPQTGKRGKHSTITIIEDEVGIRGPGLGPQTRQFTLTQTAQRIDTPDITGGTGHRYVVASNAGAYHMFTKEDDTITEVNSRPSFIGGEARYYLPPGGQLYGICENVGGSSQVGIITGATAGGTATNPNNAKLSDDVRATRTAVGQTLYVEGFSFSFDPGFTSISKVELVSEGRKQSGQFETVSFVERKHGNAGAVGSVSTDSNVTAGTARFHVAFIEREVGSATTATINPGGMTGLGLGWTQVRTQNSDDDHRRLDCWYAMGTGTTGLVTASFGSNPTSSRIVVVSYDKVNSLTPVQDSDVGATNSATLTVPALSTTNKGYVILAGSINNATSTPGGGYTEQDDYGGTTGTADNITVIDKAITSTGTDTPTATLSASKHFAAIGISLNPATAVDPVVTLSYLYNAVAGATSTSLTFSNTADAQNFLEVTNDRGSWLPADIALLRVLSTVTTIGAAQLESDQLALRITQTSSATTKVSVVQSGFQRSSGGL